MNATNGRLRSMSHRPDPITILESPADAARAAPAATVSALRATKTRRPADEAWPPRFRRFASDAAILMLLVLFTRLPLVLLIHGTFTSDSYFYYLGARSILGGHGYSILGHPTAFFPVGWPAFLAALFAVTGPSFTAVEAATIVLWVISCLLVYLLGTRMGGRAAGLTAAAIVALDPVLALWTLRACSEHLFIPLLLGACLLLTWRRGTPPLRAAAAAGALLGLSILVRSTATLLVLVVPVWLVVRVPQREAWRAAAVLAGVSLLVLAPWALRNALVMGAPVLSTNGGYTIWLGNNPHASGGFSVAGPHPKWALETPAAEVQQNRALTRRALRWALGAPAQWLRLVPLKLGHLFVWEPNVFRGIAERQTGPDPRSGFSRRPLATAERTLLDEAPRWYWLLRLDSLLFWSLATVGLIAATIRRRPGAGIAALIVAFWIVFHATMVQGEPRYMLSVTPLAAPALGWLLVSVWRRTSGERRQPAVHEAAHDADPRAA